MTPEDNCETKVLERIYFGTDTPDGPVSEKDWQAFLKTFITRKFPNGLTVFKGSGQWLGNNQVIVKEPSYVVELIHEDRLLERESIEFIIENYKTQFKQEAVLDTRSNIEACLKR